MKVRKYLLSIISALYLSFAAVSVTSCNKHVHDWTEIERTSASCTENGVIKYLCAECEETKDVVIEEAKGHNVVISPAVEPTCTEMGLTEMKQCSLCYKILAQQEVVPALGHNYVNNICSRCEHHYYTEGLRFVLSSNGEGYKVYKGTTTETNIHIPAIYNGKPVVSFYFEDFTTLTSVTIENGIKAIDYRAFSDCSSLTSIIIPDSVTSIGLCAFSGCKSLTNIIIPDSVTNIDNSAFEGCSSLRNITIGNSVTSIGAGAFEGCCALTSVTIPDSVTIVCAYAFENCSSLKTIIIGNNVNRILIYAFEGCSSLINVYYKGSYQQWINISIDLLGNEDLLESTIICNYKG